MTACMKAIKDLNFSADDAVVVILPDSIRSYLSKFVDDDWLAANDLLPPTPPLTAPSSPKLEATDKTGQEKRVIPANHKAAPPSPPTLHKQPKNDYGNATICDLRLKPVQTLSATQTVSEAIELMRDKGYDQLPITAPSSHRLVGLLTLGNCLSYLSSRRVDITSPISAVMFDFGRTDEVRLLEKHQGLTEGDEAKRGFVEIEVGTSLRVLERFFEWNAAAIVTERTQGEGLRAVAVVTKGRLQGGR
ncbi:cystathionine beta-synthase [Friedmanniomyces endolithicus]|nr:cystathionine beta-synthase [Friedmanniomyces endolithicus]